ncbi:TPA: hypothetical protein ACV4Y0_002060, partial [Streptococcus agalactiae]
FKYLSSGDFLYGFSKILTPSVKSSIKTPSLFKKIITFNYLKRQTVILENFASNLTFDYT